MNVNIKEEVLKFIKEERGCYYRDVENGWHITRCPYCGDSSSLNQGHFYFYLIIDNNYAIGYNCFKCGVHGRMTDETLELMGANSTLKQQINAFNKNAKSISKYDSVQEEKLLYFDYKIPEPRNHTKIQYIENRIGYELSKKELMDTKVVTSVKDFLDLNEINDTAFSLQQMRRLENDYVGFVTNGNSHILFRNTKDDTDRWVKYPITKESAKNKVFYSIAQPIDIFTEDEIEVNLTEGIMDILSIGYNFNHVGNNHMNIALSSKTYELMVYRLIDLGIVGSNVIINIYSDSDFMFSKSKYHDNIKLEYFKKHLAKYKPLFKRINVIYNVKKKDFGYHKSDIYMERHII